MKTIVYADVLFLMNFIINLIILKITCIFIKSPSNLPKLTIAAILGGFYAVYFFHPKADFLYIFPFKLLVSMIMLIITIQKCTFFKLLKGFAVFYLTSFSFAGILLAFVYFADFSHKKMTYTDNGIFYFDLSLSTLILSSLIVYILLWLVSAVFTKNKMLGGIKQIKIKLGKRECVLSALCDTGNLLTDPISHMPVIIADKKSVLPLFPLGIPDITTGCISGAKVRIIPYSSLGAKNEVMTGFVPDEVMLEGKTTSEVVIGISEDTLSESDEYNALFNPNLLN